MAAEPDSIPDGFEETMEENDWTEAEREAWEVLHEARPGDLVLFADRSVAMEVVDRRQTDDGKHIIEVDKPRGEGTYEVKERYQAGKPKFTSPVGRANDLHWVERQPVPRGLTEDEYATLVERLSENATDAFIRMDYADWEDAVADVVEAWADQVAFMEWPGYKHHPDWETDDPGVIFESVLEHGVYEDYPEDATLRNKAVIVLHDAVFREGREMAEASIISTETDYRDTVEKLAHHTLDRFDRKNYTNARDATRDTISGWIDDRQSPAYQSVIEHSTLHFDNDNGEYAELSPDEMARERAFDTLDHDVWELVQALNRERGEHDPTLRGLTYSDYRDLVDWLVGESLKAYDGRGFLRTTVADVIRRWADSVEAHEWEGHRHRIYAAGDVEDIFASVAIHADADPFVWNPFAGDVERRMAQQALIADVTTAASRSLDERDSESLPVPADDYLVGDVGTDISYAQLQDIDDDEVREMLSNALDAVEGDEVGWTFAEEIIEEGGRVPEATNEWMLVDYGIVQKDDTHRRLAWLNTENGNVLALTGKATDTEYGPFNVLLIESGSSSPEFHLTDVSLRDAVDYVYDYLDADRADFRVIETEDDVFVQDDINEDDISATGLADSLVPNIGLGTDDFLTLADSGARGSARWLSYWSTELKALAAFGILSTLPAFASKRLDGIRVQPNVHKKHGVGVNVSKELGADTDSPGIGGKVDADINVRPATFRRLGQRYAPRFLEYGFSEGDLGKGAVRRGGEALEYFRTFGEWEVPNATAIEATDLDEASLDELQDLGRDADEYFQPEVFNDRDKLAAALDDYAAQADTDTEDVEMMSWGRAFLDTFGGSAETLEGVLKSGTEQALMDDPRQRFIADYLDKPIEEVNIERDWEDIPEATRDDYQQYVEEQVRGEDGDYDFTWDDLERTDLGISGIMLRGLDAKALVDGAKFFNITQWLEDNLTFYGSDYVLRDPPTFEEWQEERYGPGKPSGPEEEARRLARFHKEVAAGEDPPDPIDTLGYVRDDPDDLGDYDFSQYTDEFGNAFDDVAEKFEQDGTELESGENPIEPDHEFEDGPE